MKRAELLFPRPDELAATRPPEARGVGRSGVRLMVTDAEGRHAHGRFSELKDYLHPRDLLVVNESATLAASLPAAARTGIVTINLSTKYGERLWLAEPRWSPSRPGPLPLAAGDRLLVAGVEARLVAQYPGIERLWFIAFEDTIEAQMKLVGRPIRYGYLDSDYPLAAYQTIFSRVPGSAEMPSAARPFTEGDVAGLRERGISIARIVLHTGVSSLEVESEEVEDQVLYAEPFAVSERTALAVNETRARGNRVVAIGTTVVRALESAWNGCEVAPARGFTRVYIHPARGVHAIDGLLTGLHDPATSHLAMLYAVASPATIRGAYEEAVRERYLWHEFGDSHLILR
jgi:S-adenosylmethionine:tRNA ribosyltransferase-isomerase